MDRSQICVPMRIACRECVCGSCVCVLVSCVCMCNAEVDTGQLQRHVCAGRTNKFLVAISEKSDVLL